MKRFRKNLMKSIQDEQNAALIDLILGILISGLLAALVGLLAAPDRMMFLAGLALGLASSMARAVHMAVTLDIQLDYGEKDAVAYAARNYAIRYIFVIIVMVISVKFGTSGIIGTIVGIFLMKPAAVLAPQIHKYIYTRIFGKGR